MAAGEFPPKVKASGLDTLACRREQRSCDSPADESHLIVRLIVHGRRAGVSWLSAERQTATGGLKTRDHEKYWGGKRSTGKRGTKSQGCKRQDWKTQDQISRVENARPPSMER